MALREHNQRGTQRAMGLQQLLFACFVTVSLVPLSCLGLWVQRTAYESEFAAVSDKHLLLAKNLSGALSRYATDLRVVFTEKSEAPHTVQSGQAHELLAAFNLQALACLKDDSLVYKMGDATAFPQDGLASLKEEVAQAHQDPQTVIFSPIVINTEGKPAMYLLRVNRAGVLVVASVSTEYFNRVQKAVAFGDLGHAAIVDQKGQAIAHPNAEWQAIAKDMSPISAVQAMMQEKTDVDQFYSPALDADMVAGHTFVPETGWGVMIPQPISELEAQARESRNIALLISSIGLLLAGGISWQLARVLVAPLQALMTASRQLSKGEPVEALNFEGTVLPRELHVLAQTFNQMADEVSQSRQSLEEKVAERTRELRIEVEQRRRLEEKLRDMANHDSLTELPNRRALVQELEQTLMLQSSTTQTSTILLFIDLDGFKQVNDTFGHKTGDDLLVAVTQRVQTLLPEGSRFYRLGGDEFVITLHSKPWTAADGIALGENIIAMLSQPFLVEEQAIQIGSSIGVRDIAPPAEGVTVDNVLADADTAMYQAKVKRNCVVLFDASQVA